jgi:hypothetical protein
LIARYRRQAAAAGKAFGELTTRARLAHAIEARFSKQRNVFEAIGDLPKIRSA